MRRICEAIPGSEAFLRSTEPARKLFAAAREDRITGLAAEIAFFGILSLFPALVATAAALGYVERLAGSNFAREAERTFVSWLETFLTNEGAGVVEAVRLLFEEQRGGAATVAALGALWTASRGIDGVLRALLLVHGGEERRSWLRRKLLSLAIVLGTVVALAVVLGAFVVGPLFGRGHRLAELLGFGDFFAVVWTWVRFPVVAVVLVLWATTVLHLGRASESRWRDDVPGAVVAAAGWLVLSFGFRVYLSSALSANQVIGALGGGLILLLWLFLLAASLLLGAEVNEVFAQRRRSTPSTSRPEDDSRASNPPLRVSR